MKILHLAYDAGGIHTRLYHDIINAYRTLGHDVTEAYLTGTLAETYETPANRVLALNLNPKSLKGLRRRLAVFRLRRLLIRERFDAIITHRRKPAELMAHASRGLPLRKRFAIWHDEGEFARWNVCFGAARLFRNWLLIGVSDAVRIDILSSRARFRSEQVIAINNAIDVSTIEPRILTRGEARAALGLAEGAFVFGNIGRLVPKKGQADLIRAFTQLGVQFSHAHLVIVGHGRMFDELRDIVSNSALKSQIHLTGALAEAFRYIKAFDVFVLPSYREGLPIALLEAACAHTPAIASDIGGNRAVLAGFGELVPTGNIVALSQAMQQTLQTPPALLIEQGEAFYQHLLQHFDRPIMLAQYQKLLDNPQPI